MLYVHVKIYYVAHRILYMSIVWSAVHLCKIYVSRWMCTVFVRTVYTYMYMHHSMWMYEPLEFGCVTRVFFCSFSSLTQFQFTRYVALYYAKCMHKFDVSVSMRDHAHFAEGSTYYMYQHVHVPSSALCLFLFVRYSEVAYVDTL